MYTIMKKILTVVIGLLTCYSSTQAQSDTARASDEGVFSGDMGGDYGYYFIAPFDFTMEKVFVPGNTSANQSFAVFRINGLISNSSPGSNVSLLAYGSGITGSNWTSVNLNISEGDTIAMVAIRGDQRTTNSTTVFYDGGDSVDFGRVKVVQRGVTSNSNISSSSPTSPGVYANGYGGAVSYFTFSECPRLSSTSVTNASSSTSSDGSISIDLSADNNTIRYLRWATKDGVNYPATNAEDVNGLAPGDYTLFIVTKDYEPCYLGPVTIGP